MNATATTVKSLITTLATEHQVPASWVRRVLTETAWTNDQLDEITGRRGEEFHVRSDLPRRCNEVEAARATDLVAGHKNLTAAQHANEVSLDDLAAQVVTEFGVDFDMARVFGVGAATIDLHTVVVEGMVSRTDADAILALVREQNS